MSSAMARLLLLLCAASGLLLAAVAAIPPPEEAARMARYVLHSCDWGALATLSAQEGLRGRPFANIFSLSDGPPGPCGGSGVPYLYLTDMEISVQDLEVSGAWGAVTPRVRSDPTEDTRRSSRVTQGGAQQQAVIARQCDSAGSQSRGIAGAGRDFWRSFSVASGR